MQLPEPGVALTRYPTIGAPTYAAGGAHAIRTELLSAVVVTEIGRPAPGTCGIPTNAVLSAPAPIPFTARSLMLYATPFVNPVMTTGEVLPPDMRRTHVVPPFVEYSYDVIEEPPLDVGAENATESEPSFVLTLTIDGVEAVVAGVPLTSADALDSPMKLTVRTLNR